MKVKILNLDTRPDRWVQVQAECKKFGITEYERFAAIPKGFAGFNMSMHTMLRGACDLLILEDDCQFTGNIRQVTDAISILPDDWGLLYLGANVLTPQKHYKDNIWHLDNAWTTHAVVYSKLGAEYCYKNFDPDGVVVYDEWLRTVAQKEIKCFIIKPYLAIQAPSKSDLVGAMVDYDLRRTEINLI